MNEVALTDHGFPAEWCLREGEEVADLITKGESPTWQGFSYQTDGVLFVTSENVRDGFLDVSTPKYISHRFDEKLYRSRLREGDVLINLVGASIGRSCVVPTGIGSANINQAVCLFRPSSLVCTNYISSYLQLPQVISRLLGEQVETARANVSLRDIRRFPFVTPILPEQKKIARILATLDNLIEKTEALIAKYQAIKQGMMHDLFTRGVDSSGQLRPTHEQAPDLYKPSEFGFGMIPTEWSEGTIADFCEIHNTLRFPISEEVRSSMQGDYRYYGPTGILDYINEYRVEGRFVLIGEDGDHFLKFEKQHMTILADGQFNVNNHAHILSGKPECLTEWIHLFFCHRDITFHVSRQGAGRLKLNKAALQAIPMLVPKEDEQERSYKRFKSAEKRIATETAQLRKLRKLKSGLMQDLLTGKVRVKVDEAEEVAANA